MRKSSIMMHATAVLFSTTVLAFLWYVFIEYGSGSYWQGTLRAQAFGYYFDGPLLPIATVTGLFMIVLSVGRLVQLLAPGFLRTGGWAGLRAAANTYLAVLFMVLFFVLPEIDLVADPLRGALQRIFPVLGSFGEDAAQQKLLSDSELDFPKLPYAPEKDPLGTATLTDLSGASITLGELRGKTIFLNVWATWCGPCRKEMPNIEALYESMKGEQDVLFILAACDQKAVVEKYLLGNAHKAPIYLLNDESKKKLKITAFPTTMILSKEGDIVFKRLGCAAWDGGTTKAFLQALAHGEPFTPPNSMPKKI